MYKYIIFLVTIGTAFKSMFISLGIDMMMYVLTISLILLSILTVFKTGKILWRSNLWIVPFFLYNIVSALQVSLTNSIMIGLISITGLIFYALVWFLAISILINKNEVVLIHKYCSLLLWLGVINAIFAIYQYYIDTSLFGLNVHPIYGSLEIISLGNITKRAGSLMGSPQNLGLFLGITFSILVFIRMKIVLKAILFILVIYGGILSGSAAFIIFLFIFLFSWYLYKVRSIVKIGLLGFAFIIFFAIIIVIQKIPDLDNMIISGLYIADMWTPDADDLTLLNVYLKFLQFNDWNNFLFGHGAGITDRLMEVYGLKYGMDFSTLFVPGSESYFTKLYYELGICGLILFYVPYFIAIFKSYHKKDRLHQLFFAFLIATFINLLFTPSFGGLTMSYIIWPFILYPLSVKKITFPSENLNDQKAGLGKLDRCPCVKAAM